VLQELRSFVAFDGATFGIYTEDIGLFKWLYIEPGSPNSWAGHWVVLDDQVKSWIIGGKTWAADLRQFVDFHPYLSNDPIVQQHLAWNDRAFITLPVIGPKGPTSSLSLVSKLPNVYSEETLDFVKELDLERVLMIFENDAAEERREFCSKVESDISAAGSLPRAAEILVESVHSFYKWNHVSIISIDERAQQFRMFRQACDRDCALPNDFSQALSEGMLGATLDAARTQTASTATALVVEDVRAKPNKYGFISTNEPLLSAMTYPIQLNGEWRWIINVEAEVTNAFHGPDMDAVRELCLALADELSRLYKSELNRLLLEKMPEGVVIVSPSGSILSANRTAAERFLGRKNSFGRLIDYAADDETREILRGNLPDTCRRLNLRDEEGKQRTALATRNDLSAEYQSSVWFLSDLETFDWNVAYRYLRAVVNDVAQQTRGSLLLASTTMQKLVRQFQGQTVSASIDDAVGRTLAELAKADITFERLAGALSAIKEPVREWKPINLRTLIKDVVSGLPERDQKRISVSVDRGSVRINGDASRLRYVFRSIIGYLLRYRSDDDGGNTAKAEFVSHPSSPCLFYSNGNLRARVSNHPPTKPRIG
jgi:PAS domain-containing protein